MKKPSQPRQLSLLKNENKAYGGDLLKTRKGRARGRPLDTKNTMHLVLRSSQARGSKSFWHPKNKIVIQQILQKFSKRYGVKICSLANVGNHLHLQIKLSNRSTYRPFIRAITGAIAMAVSGRTRWTPMKDFPTESRSMPDKAVEPKLAPLTSKKKLKFWDCRPFTRVVIGRRGFLNLRDYININQLEGFGVSRAQARFFMKSEKFLKADSS